MKVLAIIGSGELGRQIAYHAITDGHFNNVVFFDDYTDELTAHGYDILGGVDYLESAFAKAQFHQLIIAIGYKHMEKRAELFNRFHGKIPFATIVHSTCHIDSTAMIGDGCILYPGCTIDMDVVIGNNVLINIATVISHDSNIGSHTFISPAVALAGKINVGKMCILGIGTVIIDNIIISKGVRTGGSTVITKDIQHEGLYVGNPAKFIR